MAGIDRQINYKEVKPSVTNVRNPDRTSYQYTADDKTGIFFLAEHISDSNSMQTDKEKKIKCRPSSKEGVVGLDILLPSGVSFRVDDKHITVSDFGLTSAQIKDLRQFFYMHGIEDFSLPNAEDREFEEKLQQAENELASEPQHLGDGERRDVPPEPSANDNVPSPTEEMSDEEILAYKRGLAEQAKAAASMEASNKALNYGGGKKLTYPSQEAILEAFNSHVTNTQKDMSDNYKINSIGNGYELVFYADSEQKNAGAEADKKGNVKPNYQFALRGEIFRDSRGSPHLSITFMTPKYGKMEDWMFDEVMNLADGNKITHMKFNAGLQHKAAFFNACAKKLMIPTGIKLKQKDVDAMIKIAKDNNDKPADRQGYYLRLAAQLEENMQNENTYSDEAHPFHETIKNLRDWARTESDTSKAKLKYKKFNQFYENNIMGKILPDGDDEKRPRNDAVKELASGRAYIDLLTYYRDDEGKKFENLPDDKKMAFYQERYNEYVYSYDKEFSESLNGLSITDRKQAIKDVYDEVRGEITSLTSNLEYDLGVKVDYPHFSNRDYMGDKEAKGITNPNKKRIQKGREIVEAREQIANNSQSNTNLPPAGRGGR